MVAVPMGADQGHKPTLSGRGMLRIEDFGRSSGLDQSAVYGIFDDELPSREALAAMGMLVRDDYNADSLRSFELTDDDDPDGK